MALTIGLDISKRFFQVHAIDHVTRKVERVKLRRAEVLPFFANRPQCLVAMEACGSSHHWARQLRALGHEVRLIATKFVRPFVKTNKTDAADASAICEAAQRPEMRFVPVKSEQQQSILCLHSMREGLVKARTAQIHQIRAAFYEFGIDLPTGRHWCVKTLPAAFAHLEGKIPSIVIEALRMQLELIRDLTSRIDEIERKLDSYKASRRSLPTIAPSAGRWPADSYGDRGGRRRRERVSVCSRILCLAWSRAAAIGHGRPCAIARDK